ncbi:membrane hypothetical protein [uncultured Desulfatiglans sp.]|uniref:Uncharacterized protein n=1 Tax=Uncultured Desulfatiglans sp. TaxID=1748965 RepID=A0A653A8L5_UNCDX|nr:membrane hypothetical protein [uncultured Desulfatiglans sp.]
MQGETGLSVVIARIASIIYLAAAAGALFSRSHYRRLIEDFYRNAALVYLAGFMAVVLGFLMVSSHNLWVKDWRVLITILGWLALIKGVLLISFPGFVQGYSRPFFGERGLMWLPLAAVPLGLLFGYFGFLY